MATQKTIQLNSFAYLTAELHSTCWATWECPVGRSSWRHDNGDRTRPAGEERVFAGSLREVQRLCGRQNLLRLCSARGSYLVGTQGTPTLCFRLYMIRKCWYSCILILLRLFCTYLNYLIQFTQIQFDIFGFISSPYIQYILYICRYFISDSILVIA